MPTHTVHQAIIYHMFQEITPSLLFIAYTCLKLLVAPHRCSVALVLYRSQNFSVRGQSWRSLILRTLYLPITCAFKIDFWLCSLSRHAVQISEELRAVSKVKGEAGCCTGQVNRRGDILLIRTVEVRHIRVRGIRLLQSECCDVASTGICSDSDTEVLFGVALVHNYVCFELIFWLPVEWSKGGTFAWGDLAG